MFKTLLLPRQVLQLSLVILVLLQFNTFASSSKSTYSFPEVESTTWNGTSWSNLAPTILKIAVISGDYNTASFGSFAALKLVVNAGYTLTIDNYTYVEVEGNVDIIGNIIVESKGAFVQNSPTGSFYVDSGGQAIVNKVTAVLNHWYDYTYWSSPVLGTTVNQAFASSNVSRRFWFNAENYLDILKLDPITNTMVSGHDDIDDDANDWQLLNGADVLLPGRGYATTHNSAQFVAGNAYKYSFDGPFNNGTINVPIHYNGDNGDNDWNFIGNPYPSAIKADSFFNANSGMIGGAIYFWSHGTPPSSSYNGNETLNFTSDDYAIINAGSGEIAGGSHVIPKRFIPSGQGFFVQGLANGNAVFNNAMRMVDFSSNNQFFRQNATPDNKFWLNLSTESGLFNQVLVAYVDGATNGNDGQHYDAPRNLSTTTAAIIYTGIESDFTTKLAIQGKAKNSLNTNEIIPLGFYTSISESVQYRFSIAQIQGLFFETEQIYIKDYLLNNLHNLSESDYEFESATGEFNNRFEIVFNPQTLSIEATENDKQLVISQPDSNQLSIETLNGAYITKLQIIDQLGRLVNSQTPQKESVNIDTQHMATGIYITYIELNNGYKVSKKILKRS
ncbi:T9SS type A sorting domain-containing protein [Paucihalobacter sp.]|uniref:T9SS type A sorting domain-containing protein n=1 Tax=Paucihalobacter sp. TaxID=2850405 RepID=UPI002FE3F7E8